MKLWDNEPAMILAVINAAIALGLAFGLTLTPTQIGAIMAFVAAVLGFITRSQVTPNANVPPTISTLNKP